jgi:uncharacterized protein
MQCPKCDAAMQSLDVPSMRSLRCSQCQGVWVSVGEERELIAAAARVDTGDVAVGAHYNGFDRITCPSCTGDTQLIRMVDAAQPHIWFESCGACFGRFYDAGELRDTAEHTWPSSSAISTRPSACEFRAAAQPFTGSPPRPTQPQLRIGVPGGNTRWNIATRRRFGFTTTGLRAALSNGRSALLSEYATAIWS